jgi:hypothetical protein
MLTDSPPRKNRAEFLESDRIKTLDLPPNENLLAIAKRLESAIKADSLPGVRRACAEFLATASDFYKVPNCGIRVLAARPLRVRENYATELFGDYHPDTMLLRVWMRTAVRKEVTSFGTFLSTLSHEFCHHLDLKKLGFVDSWHTRGFYERAATLYHHARDTAPKKLIWVPMSGGRWRIDWQRTNRSAYSLTPARQAPGQNRIFSFLCYRPIPSHAPLMICPERFRIDRERIHFLRFQYGYCNAFDYIDRKSPASV